MRHTKLSLVALAFAAGSLLHCELGAPARAGEDDTSAGDIPYRSGARLKAVYWESEDGARLPTEDWFDTELETICRMRLAADGLQRCLPNGAEYWPVSQKYYEDPNCSERVYPVESEDGAYMMGAPGGGIWTRSSTYRKGDLLYTEATGGTCVATDEMPSLVQFMAALGERVPDRVFVEFAKKP